ncbi:hypothetical protein NP493_46g08011 [Ridgeia piscesae]|uniref:Uncharacterized protein n=1 Tax=Ridgeia piscesae TaxID=27915 RepID=A0AAD9PBW3_RIDPI|nr:hypothetical protein NP493_46g08011 [Ridgeia piscesae]
MLTVLYIYTLCSFIDLFCTHLFYTLLCKWYK